MGTVVTGSVQNILICAPLAAGETVNAIDSQACPPSGAQAFKLQSMQAYVLDSSAQSLLEAAAKPFDYEYAGVVWSVAFTMVVGLYLASAKVGAVLGLIRQG
ncbi:hypothetical protein [Cupriavidus neocaledonicus]|uniref:Uncharacterized protein n=1 Tax=Cupriavidus neocaledonicus TaxID=1040979 RepID=A0ABY1UZE9_9BURK|nr:hypothetical protein [Cupriavidus neocaledonicus]SOZ35598.1 conserved hypothetical protein [Cupriavidus neocaledonicus]